MNALCVMCQHVADGKIFERGCECKCHAGAAVYPRLWTVPKGYKFATTDQGQRTRKSLGIKGAKAAKRFRRAQRTCNDAA